MLYKEMFECGDTFRISTKDKITDSGIMRGVRLSIFC